MSKKYNTLFLALGIFLAGFGLFFSGYNVSNRDGQKLVVDLFLAAFGLVFTIFLVQDRIYHLLRKVHQHDDMVERVAKMIMESEFGDQKETKPAVKVPVTTETSEDEQRQLNNKRGRGPITDAEWKQQQREKRRAARAIKKTGSVLITEDPETVDEVEPTLKEKISRP